MRDVTYYRGAKERNDAFLKASENFAKKIAFEIERMSTQWENISGDSKKWEKIRKKKLRRTERKKKLDFTAERWHV